MSETTRDEALQAQLKPERQETVQTATPRPALFWLSFLLLNIILFLPAFLLSSGDSTLLPRLVGDPREIARQILAWRSNLDPLRINAEITLLAASWILGAPLHKGRWRRPFLFLFIATFLLAMVYAAYESLSIFFYLKDPVLYAQLPLLVDGLPFLASHLTPSPLLTATILLAAALVTGSIVLLLRLIFGQRQVADMGFVSKALLIALTMFVLASFLFNGHALAGPKSVVSCLSCKIVRNISSSFAAADQVKAVGRLPFDQVYDYGEHALLSQPDIYLIFVESYGSILYRRGFLKTPYLALTDEIEQELQAEGWFAASAFSESPTWGGGSWMAYTSALFGLHIDTHPAYQALIERFPDGGYPHLGTTLQAMGYEHDRVTSISVELEDEEWQRYKSFFGVDHWLRYSDLDYNGRHYGWGPAPPDQFVLNSAKEKLKSADKPLFLFMITQNSHYPWLEVPEVVDDWRTLNDGSNSNSARSIKTETVSVNPADYLASIRYELRFLAQFILQEVDDDAIVILIGDHQPGYITAKTDGFNTPLHILSKDKAFVDTFTPFGFEPGLVISGKEAVMKHEGFYSLLMHTLLTRYGRGDRLPPPYMADGAPLFAAGDQSTPPSAPSPAGSQ